MKKVYSERERERDSAQMKLYKILYYLSINLKYIIIYFLYYYLYYLFINNRS